MDIEIGTKNVNATNRKETDQTSEWTKIKEEFGYDQIHTASILALDCIKSAASAYGEPPDFFQSIRSRPHLDEFDVPSAIFYRSAAEAAEVYGSFSGWYKIPDGYTYMAKHWPTLEHSFQANKFWISAPEIAERIHQAPLPRKAKVLSRKYVEKVRPDWPQVKEIAMLGATLAIARQYSPIRELLESTGQVAIIEDSYDDEYWGRGTNFSGGNGLGRTWMMTREILRTGNTDQIQQMLENLIS